MSQNQPLSCQKQNNITIEGAIAAIANAKVEEIAIALRKVPRSVTAKIAIAIGMAWQSN